MLEFFSSFIGVRYPFPKYAQVAAADFIYGGMENTSATTQTDAALLDERVSLDYTSDELVAHELAHQWFGDYLTCKDWSHAWLNESFATYFDPLFKRSDKGEDEFLYALRGNAEAYFQEDKEHYRRSIVTKVYKRPERFVRPPSLRKGLVGLAHAPSRARRRPVPEIDPRVRAQKRGPHRRDHGPDQRDRSRRPDATCAAFSISGCSALGIRNSKSVRGGTPGKKKSMCA